MAPVTISLGFRCDVAYQIRRRYGQPEAYPFDWLVTPLSSIAPMIRDDFRHIADGDCLEVVAYKAGETVLNKHYNVFLHHEFDRAPDVTILPGWRDHIGAVAAKYRHIVDRFRSVLREAEAVTFVRRAGDLVLPDETLVDRPPALWLDLMDALEEATARPPTLVVLNHPGLPQRQGLLNARVGAPTSAEWPLAGDRWRGNSASYDRLFDWVEGQPRRGHGDPAV